MWRPLPSRSRTSPVGEQLGAHEPVHERGLPDTRRAEQSRRLAFGHMGTNVLDAKAGDRALDKHVDQWRDLGDPPCGLVGVAHEIGLGEHDHGQRATAVREHELALEAADVERGGQRVRDEHHVDVGEHHLLAGLGTGVSAHERARSRQHGLDQGHLVALGARDGDPVAYHRAVLGLGGALHEMGGRLHALETGLGGDEGEAPVDAHDSARLQARIGEG